MPGKPWLARRERSRVLEYILSGICRWKYSRVSPVGKVLVRVTFFFSLD